jgi:hypothetical protein
MSDPQTTVAIDGTCFLIDGRPTYPGNSTVEGLLFNVRTVNSTFDDSLNEVDWFDDDGSRPENGNAGYGAWKSPESADANTARFIDGLAEYRAYGILAVNLNFQGGHPLNGKPWIEVGHGSAGSRPNGHRDFYHNSAFRADGSLDPTCAARISSIIEACDRLGMVVLLQLFYFGQDSVFPGEEQILAATDSAVDFLCEKDYCNVIIEIANEVMEGHYHHDILKPGRVSELVYRVRDRAHKVHSRDLPVTTSEAALLNPNQWTPDQIDDVFSACDLIVIHGGDNVETGRVGDAGELVEKADLIQSRPWFREIPRPILTNESQGEASFDSMVSRNVSFGLHSIIFQTMFPPRWGVWDNETTWFFNRVRDLTQTS